MDNFTLYGAKIVLPSNNSDIWQEPQKGLAIEIESGIIKNVGNEEDLLKSAKNPINLNGGILSAGFIDIQVNGGGNILFNDKKTTEALEAIAKAHSKFGTTAMLPTLMTDTYDIMEKAIKAVDNAIAKNIDGIIGIHLEGPFISKEKKGIHDKNKIVHIDEQGFEIIKSLRNGKTLVTLAPENVPSQIIQKLNQDGIIVFGGHSNANFATTQKAIDAGMVGVTHLYNAMSPLNSREPNMVGAAFLNKLKAGIIIDCVHVHPASVKIAYNNLGADNLIIITDAMPVVGGNDSFILNGEIIKARDGSCYNDQGTLAGSALNMAMAVRNANKYCSIPLAQCLQMASQTPAKLLGLNNSMGSIKIGNRADLVHIDNNINILSVWIGGKQTD